MKVYGFVGRERGKEDMKGQLEALNGHLSQLAVNTLLTGKADGIADADTWIASCIFHNSLRLFVDAWIGSAKTAEDERPWQRAVKMDSHLMDYIQRNPAMLELTEEGPRLLLFPHVWDKRKKLPKFAEEGLFRRLEDATLRERVRKILPFAFDASLALFLQLLDSPERTRLFRCDGCGTYFIRARKPKRETPIYHGTFCAACKGKGKDRARRTVESRKRRTQKKIELAVDAWAEWTPGNRCGVRADWIVKKVNAKLPAGQNPIKVNWVTRHRAEIETEVERRKHAKG